MPQNIQKAAAARADKILSQPIRIDGKVTTWRAFVDAGPVDLSEGDGMIDWNRTKFNRLNYAQQREYEAALRARRYYYVNGVLCPKTVYDYAASKA